MMIPDPSCRRTPEYQKKLERREDRHFFGSDYPDIEWVDQLIVRLKETPPDLDYTDRDYADIEKARHILYRVAVKKGCNPNEPRVPAGNPDGGQWTDAGGGGSTRTGTPSSIRDNSLFTPVAYKPSATAKPRGYVPNDKSPAKPVYGNGVKPVADDDWNTFNSYLLNTPGLDPVEKHAYLQTFGAEGGFKPDPKNGAVAGVRQTYLDDIFDAADYYDAMGLQGTPEQILAEKLDMSGVMKPGDLEPKNITDVYKYYFNNNLDRAGGSAALAKVGNPYVAAALADTVFREGAKGAGNIIKEAVLRTDPTLKEAIGKESGVLKEKTFQAYSSLAKNPATLGLLLDNVAKERKKAEEDNARGRNRKPNQGDFLRFEYFRFEKVRAQGRDI